ncbi:MAG: Trehalose synthase [Methanobacterium sp. PtaU1.Bin097]|jgi:N-acetyl-alpha-D-glucosaminyl L-malate synthase BshA|nr:MAG: Trehalose synthase [Methanobacterium sp. PtaU1.Bin097]
MNICLLGQFPPHIGGVSSHTYLLARELAERGDEVHVLTYPHPDIKDLEGIHVETAPTVNIKGLRGFLFLISATVKLISMARKYNIDLIHAHFLIPPGLIAVLVGGLTGKKVAVTVHGSDIFIQSRNPVLRPIIKYVLEKADYIAVVDEAIKEQILELGVKGADAKIKVTPNAVDLEKFKPDIKSDLADKLGLNPEKNLILFVGNLVPQKGLKYLLEAKKQMKSQAELVIVGGGPLMTELQEKVEKDGIEDVHFTGARRDIEKIMPAGDVFVLPSTSEGFPITLLEAFASGLPAVATSVGGIKELVTPDVGFLVKPGDPAALGEVLDKIIQDYGLRHKMAENAPVKAREYGYLEIPY